MPVLIRGRKLCQCQHRDPIVGSVILQDGTFLTVGGSEIKGHKAVVTNVIEQYFPSKNSWITWNISMPTSRTNYGAAIYRDELYLVGGQTEGGKSTATVDILNLQTMKWRSGPPLPYVLMGHRVVSLHKIKASWSLVASQFQKFTTRRTFTTRHSFC